MVQRTARYLGLDDLPFTSREPLTIYTHRGLFFLKGISAVATLCLCAAALMLFAQASPPWVKWLSVLGPLTLTCLGIGTLLGKAWTGQPALRWQAKEGHRLSPPQDESPAGWGVLLPLLAGWGVTLRLVLLISIPIAAVIAIVAVVVIYLGPLGVAAILTGGAGGSYGFKRVVRAASR
jgi:hypothetical protein